MSAPDQSGRRALTAEQRARVQRAVDDACSEIERETAALIAACAAMAAAERARKRAWRVVAIVALWLVGCVVVLAILWALGRVAVAIGGVL